MRPPFCKASSRRTPDCSLDAIRLPASQPRRGACCALPGSSPWRGSAGSICRANCCGTSSLRCAVTCCARRLTLAGREHQLSARVARAAPTQTPRFRAGAPARPRPALARRRRLKWLRGLAAPSRPSRHARRCRRPAPRRARRRDVDWRRRSPPACRRSTPQPRAVRRADAEPRPARRHHLREGLLHRPGNHHPRALSRPSEAPHAALSHARRVAAWRPATADAGGWPRFQRRRSATSPMAAANSGRARFPRQRCRDSRCRIAADVEARAAEPLRTRR